MSIYDIMQRAMAALRITLAQRVAVLHDSGEPLRRGLLVDGLTFSPEEANFVLLEMLAQYDALGQSASVRQFFNEFRRARTAMNTAKAATREQLRQEAICG